MKTTVINPLADSLFREIFSASNDDALDLVERLARERFPEVERGAEYVYAPGTIPVLLVAHVDTVHDAPPQTIYYDPKNYCAWSPEGLGADDRAGVYAITLLSQGHDKPHVLYTTGEETGGTGAMEAASSIQPDGIRCIIEIDRAGKNDACTYQCDSPQWKKWLRRRGWSVQHGTYTDIVELMPSYGVCGVNFSAGYYHQHSTSEHLRTNELARTIDRVASILRSPPRWPFAYVEEKRTYFPLERGWWGRKSDAQVTCPDCRWTVDADEITSLGICTWCASAAAAEY